jgi:tellurite resistance protein TehA-like permease
MDLEYFELYCNDLIVCQEFNINMFIVLLINNCSLWLLKFINWNQKTWEMLKRDPGSGQSITFI